MYDVSRYGENCPYCKSEGLKPEIKEKKVNLVEELDDDDRTTAYWAKDSRVDPVVQYQKEISQDVGKVWTLGLKEI